MPIVILNACSWAYTVLSQSGLPKVLNASQQSCKGGECGCVGQNCISLFLGPISFTTIHPPKCNTATPSKQAPSRPVLLNLLASSCKAVYFISPSGSWYPSYYSPFAQASHCTVSGQPEAPFRTCGSYMGHIGSRKWKRECPEQSSRKGQCPLGSCQSRCWSRGQTRTCQWRQRHPAGYPPLRKPS